MIRAEFFIFAAMLLGIAVFHRRALSVALLGLCAILLYKLLSADAGAGIHLAQEWSILANLFALLLGFELLAKHFKATGIPDLLPRFLPGGWAGGFTLLALVFVMSSFLDNIAGAVIGATMAATVFNNRLNIGFLAAIVAAANAGGSGSVIGDTTTTMMWIEGVSPVDVLHAYVAACAAFVCFAVPAAIRQQRFAPMVRDARADVQLDWARIFVVIFILATAVAASLLVNLHWPQYAGDFPFLGTAVWIAILLTAPLRRPSWSALSSAARGALFLVVLVASASLMPVEGLPAASWPTAFGLGFLSSVFDNIPLTKLALKQGGYDWGILAYAVGFGGSMIWFGSSAGVAVTAEFPQGRSIVAWLKEGWPVAFAYVIGFFVLLALLGWRP